MIKKIELIHAQKRLVLIWCILLAPTVLFFFIQMQKMYVENCQSATTLVLSSFLPTMSLLIASMIVETGAKNQSKIDQFFFWLAAGLSAFYLLLLFLLVVVLCSALQDDDTEAFTVLQRGMFFLAPFLQGIVGAALGIFLRKAEVSK